MIPLKTTEIERIQKKINVNYSENICLKLFFVKYDRKRSVEV